jgi:hypothetical protein
MTSGTIVEKGYTTNAFSMKNFFFKKSNQRFVHGFKSGV